ncbi:PepSY domain-containing protein [Gillisia sp. M10.2A]|uniref:PepSY domain-containing protein n=1 Tax=Gillisia lutea TaxID=2909668 RepID=A0ABS9EEJ5_9FLAO|nr:PepSY-associated TM helix domain-containing protein [Gillisia lutea]MCF4101290.1 PepSY domain-containing protein [Gillisia lutea]
MKKKRKKENFKKLVRKLHLWLGLTSGLIVFIVALTGCIFAFHDEIKDLTRDWRLVDEQDVPLVLPSVLQNKVKTRFPEASTNVVMYQGRNRSAYVYSVINEIPYNIYFNPYNGEFLHIENLNKDFFLIIEDLHMHLLLPEKIGKHIVGVSTFVFIFMLISGVVLWWPKKKKGLKKKFSIKWNAKWRRVNYDIHNVVGIYVSILALVIAITGLNFAYTWVQQVIYETANLGKNYPEDEVGLVISNNLITKTKKSSVDIAFMETLREFPRDEMYFVWEQNDSLPIVTGAYPTALNFDHQSNLYFHPNSGKLLKEHGYSEKSLGLRLQEMNYGLHTGQYFGITGKIFAFLASLFVTTLPVSGFLIWWGRKKKKSKKK